MKELVFATNNPNKLKEGQSMLGNEFKLLTLKEIGCDTDIPEDQDTLEGNAKQKAQFLFEKYGKECFADDTGLEVKALGGAPGVYSARFAGPQRNSDDNMDKVLSGLEDKKDRRAQFRTVICLILDGKEYLFEGIAKGEICEARSGVEGFGYDPIFKPLGYQETFAEMSVVEKNSISHRGQAVRQLVDFLLRLP
jgi:XTP/dITP diphosphohydrolase